MKYIEAPENFEPDKNEMSIFLAGGISDCSNWQEEMKNYLSDTGLVILNPRRDNFPIHIPAEARKQIEWEYNHLRKASMISFWFPLH